MESFWTLASAYQPLHCDISNQVALELCQIRWKRSAHKERSIDFKAELLRTQMLLDNFTHYLLQQEFLFGSISWVLLQYPLWKLTETSKLSCFRTAYTSTNFAAFKQSQSNSSFSYLRKMSYKLVNHFYLHKSRVLRQPLKEECYWVPPATWCHRSPCSRTYTDCVVLSSGACSLTRSVLSHWPPPVWCLW